MIIEAISVTEFQQNARIVVDTKEREGLVVDPGGGVSAILATIRRHDVLIREIFITHGHLDHCGKAEELAQAIEREQGQRPQIIAHRLEIEMLRGISRQAQLFALSDDKFSNVTRVDRQVEENDEITVGSIKGRVIHIPGHSPGHIALYIEDCTWEIIEADGFRSHGSSPLLFSGDVLFAGSVGRTDLPGGSHKTLISSIRDKILVLSDDTVVLPGHGPYTTVGIEREGNPFLIS